MKGYEEHPAGTGAYSPGWLSDLLGGAQLITEEEFRVKVLEDRVSRTTVYAAMRSGQIPSIRIGRRLFIPVAALERILSGKEQE